MKAKKEKRQKETEEKNKIDALLKRYSFGIESTDKKQSQAKNQSALQVISEEDQESSDESE